MADAPQIPMEEYVEKMAWVLAMSKEQLIEDFEVAPCGCDWDECRGVAVGQTACPP